MKPFFVYLLRCSDGSYYCGQTDDIENRLQQHYAGEIGYTSTRKPVVLVWQGEFDTRVGAIAFERQLKGWSRAKKEALIAGDWDRIQQLAKSKTSTPAEVLPLRPLRQAQGERGISQGEGGISQGEREISHSEREIAQGERGMSQGEGGISQGERGMIPDGSGIAQSKVLIDAILHGAPAVQRRAVAKAITLLESTRRDHQVQGDELLSALLPHTGQSFRLGISGVPGVGKSTFIEALGMYLIAQGKRVAVLAVDPSSTVSGGSILGDKTRMELLSVQEWAFIRPSPSSGTLGGVAEKTRDAIAVCEAAGYDVVIVETVGVGQSETAVANMTDMFVLMQLPNAGDDLQAIKKGVMEMADLVVINKADIDPDAAMRARAQITSALRLLGLHGHPEHLHHDAKIWHPQVLQLSALKCEGVDRFWTAVTEFKSLQSANSRLAARRQTQAQTWMWERIDAGLKLAFAQHPRVRELLPQLTADVTAGRVPASTAARQLLEAQHSFSTVRAEPFDSAQDRPVEAPTNIAAIPSTGAGRTDSSAIPSTGSGRTDSSAIPSTGAGRTDS